MFVVGGLIVGNPDDTRESIEANLAFARRYVDWPYIQHPTPYPGTPMTREFRERGLIVDEDVAHYDGTTAVVRTAHLPADDIEFLRWRAERWMKVRHLPAAFVHSPGFVLRHGARNAGAHIYRDERSLGARAGRRAHGIRALSEGEKGSVLTKAPRKKRSFPSAPVIFVNLRGFGVGGVRKREGPHRLSLASSARAFCLYS